MAYTVLARRYRSGTFDEVIGQEHIAQTLKKAITSGRIAHAYLFCGTRGTGKTSTARILAKSLNCLNSPGPTTQPCGQCDSCQAIARGDDIDVIEIDAASNTGVDNVREIIENSQYRPARSRFKIYIIDEVHMLSKSAFNALLKTLEEPPSHVKFILATTEPEKVLPTILSRCQRYDFRNIPSREIAAHLKKIVASEKITADDDALALVARAGAGSMRDALSLLDRLLSLGNEKLTVEAIESTLGLPRTQRMSELIASMGSGNVAEVLTQTDELLSSGLSTDTLIAALLDQLRNLLIARTCGSDSPLLDLAAQSKTELDALASKFDAVSLSQDIAILEELRRNLRHSQTGRAMIDATLVRLTLADQFTAISQLLDPSQAAATPEQKKNGEINRPAASTVPIPTRPPQLPIAVSPVETTTEEEDDDDLPRPGKVWEGPSLKDALAQQARLSNPIATKPAAPAAAPNAPPAAVDANLQQIWDIYLIKIAGEGSSMAGVLTNVQLIGEEDGMALLLFPREVETFAKQWSNNGKKDIVAKALTEARGKPIGVRFLTTEQLPTGSPHTANAAAKPSPPAPAAVSTANTAPAPANGTASRAASPAVAPAPPARLSPELLQEALADPLVQDVLKEFGGTVIKVE